MTFLLAVLEVSPTRLTSASRAQANHASRLAPADRVPARPSASDAPVDAAMATPR